MRTVKKTLFSLAILLFCLAAARMSHHATRGFRLSKIQGNLLQQQPSLEDLATSPLLQQKFHFFARGLQSFVFLSEDKNYVLKFFNNRYQKKIQLFDRLSYLPGMKMWMERKKNYCQNKLNKECQSYEIAFEDMQERTGLVYLHSGPSSHLPYITIVDPLHIAHQIDPNKMGFLIQKRASLVYPTLLNYLQKDSTKAKQALRSLIDLFFWKWRHCIDDNDPLIRTNYGFIEDKAVQIDVGPLCRREQCEDINTFTKKLQHSMASLKFFLQENAPELLPFLEDELRICE